jgi:hypothetical protein
MNKLSRRGFISILAGGVATIAAVREFPFRVFSFPTEVKLATTEDLYTEFFNVPPWQMAMIEEISRKLDEQMVAIDSYRLSEWRRRM